MNRTDQLVELAYEAAAALPRPGQLHRLGYDRAVDHVEAAFMAAIDMAKKTSYKALTLWLVSRAEDPRYQETGLNRLLVRLGQLLDELVRGGKVQPAEVADLLGYTRWAYVGLMPHWVFQAYPYSVRWGRYATQRIWFKELPVEERGVAPEDPEGWVVDTHTLHMGDWVTVIKAVDPDAPVPPGWEELEPDESWEVVIFWR